jgi:hypothetical protein
MPSISEFGGLDNQNNPIEFGLKRLSVAENVDITRNNKIVTRKGRTMLRAIAIQAASATKTAIIYQSGSELHKIIDADSSVLLETGLTETKTLFAEELDGKIYWSNTAECGVIENNNSRPLGVPSPITQGYSEITGSMPSGTYLYALTFIRDDGFESGAGLSGQAYITRGGISVLIPRNVPSNVTSICLYMSNVNGDVMYLANTVNIASQNITYIGDTLSFGVALVNQFCDKPLPFQCACYYKGRMYYAQGGVLWSSLPFSYELINYSQDFVAFDSDIVVCAAVRDGIYIATNDAHYFLSGNDTQDFSRTKVLEYGAIKSAAVAVDTIGDKSNGVIWASSKGAIAGFDGGQVLNLTDGVFALGDASSANCAYREQDGQKHLIISLNK